MGSVAYLFGLGATGERLRPTASQILPEPKQGFWYRILKDQTWYGVAKKAYGKADVKKGLLTMNASTWNDHISRKKKGWESYKVKGLQSTPDYDINDPLAPVMSGSAYPVAWIPPITGEEPEQVYPEPDPIVTTPVEPTPGGPSDEHIISLIEDYMDKHPPPPGPAGKTGKTGAAGKAGPTGGKGDPGPAGKTGKTGAMGPQGEMGPPGPAATKGQIAALVKDYLDENPPAKGAKGDPGPVGAKGNPGGIGPAGKTGAMGPKGDPGEMGPPGPAATKGQIAALVKDYLDENPPAKGAKGDPGAPGPVGPQGVPGAPGAPGGQVSTGQIQAAVQDYMSTHPIPAPEFEWSAVDKRIQDALKGVTGGGGTSTVSYVALASAGIVGAAAVLAMAKRRTT